MKVFVFVLIALALASAGNASNSSEIQVPEFLQEKEITLQCDIQLAKWGTTIAVIVSDFTGEFKFFPFVQHLINATAAFKDVEEACEGQWRDVIRTAILAAVPAEYRQCTTDVMDGVEDLVAMIITIIQGPTEWYPITKSVLVVVNDIVDAAWSCANPGVAPPQVIRNGQWADQCSVAVNNALPLVKDLYNNGTIDMANALFYLPAIQQFQQQCIAPFKN